MKNQEEVEKINDQLNREMQEIITMNRDRLFRFNQILGKRTYALKFPNNYESSSLTMVTGLDLTDASILSNKDARTVEMISIVQMDHLDQLLNSLESEIAKANFSKRKDSEIKSTCELPNKFVALGSSTLKNVKNNVEPVSKVIMDCTIGGVSEKDIVKVDEPAQVQAQIEVPAQVPIKKKKSLMGRFADFFKCFK